MGQHKRTFKNKNFRGDIGVAAIDITPPVGIYARQWGAAAHHVSSKNDALGLQAVCMALRDNEQGAVKLLLSADLGVWRSSRVKDEMLRAIRESFQIPASDIIFSFTHTHAGPVLSPEESEKPGGDKIEPYIAYLKTQIQSVVGESIQQLAPCVLTWNYGTANLATNRDVWIEEERAFLTGFNPGSVADNTLLVGRIYDTQKKAVVGTLVNYACHPTTLAWQNEQISADYVGHMRELVEHYTASPTLFIQGASGELAPMEQYTANMDVVRKNGRQLGFAVLATLENMLAPDQELYFKAKVPSGADLAHWDYQTTEWNNKLSTRIEYVDYRLKPIPLLAEIEDQYRQETDRVKKEKLWRQRQMRLQFGDTDRVKIPFWVWQIGDGLFIAQQNETYSIFQQTLRTRFQDHCVVVANIANGSAGYLPPRERYKDNCYPVKQTPFAEGSLEELAERVIRTVEHIVSNDL